MEWSGRRTVRTDGCSGTLRSQSRTSAAVSYRPSSDLSLPDIRQWVCFSWAQSPNDMLVNPKQHQHVTVGGIWEFDFHQIWEKSVRNFGITPLSLPSSPAWNPPTPFPSFPSVSCRQVASLNPVRRQGSGAVFTSVQQRWHACSNGLITVTEIFQTSDELQLQGVYKFNWTNFQEIPGGILK